MNEQNQQKPIDKNEKNKAERSRHSGFNPSGIVIALIASISAVLCFSIASGNFVEYKKSSNSTGISVTGSASYDFEADLIVWRGSFSNWGETPKSAYQSIKRDATIIQDYLTENGVKEDEIVFSSVSISQRYDVQYEYDDEGNIIYEHSEPDGYDLYQSVEVTSNDVDKIDQISRDITKLIESDVAFVSESPEYYYTKLDELKLQLIEEATQNAKSRVDIIAQNTGARIGTLLTANLGVFQITAQNSDNEDYSYGGTFNTTSRKKTATVTVKLNYEVN